MTAHSTKRNPERFFRTDEVKASLGKKSVRGGLAVGSGQIFRFAVQMVMNVILGRLLSPGEFGIVAMVIAIQKFLMVMKDLGLTYATIQRAKITHAQASNLFWINLGFSVLLILGLISISSWLATFYNQPEVELVTLVIALAFLPVSISSQHQAIMARQMRFGQIISVENIAIGTGVVVAVVAAFLGASYWSLVLYHVVQSVLTGAGFWVMCGWIPGLPRRKTNVRPLLAFGGNMLVFKTVNYLSRSVDQILIGKFVGAQALGFYERAYRIFLQPLSQVQYPLERVAVPAMSRMVDEPVRYRSFYMRLIRLLGMLLSPVLALSVVMADEIVYLIFGPGWSETAELFQILGISAIFTPFTFTTGWLLSSQNRMPEIVQMGITNSALTIGAIVVGLNWGTIGIAWAVVLAAVLFRIPFQFWIAGRKGPVSSRDMYGMMPLPVAIAALVAVASLLCRQFLHTGMPPLDLLIAVVVSGLVATGTLTLIPQGRQVFREAKNIRQLLRSK